MVVETNSEYLLKHSDLDLTTRVQYISCYAYRTTPSASHDINCKPPLRNLARNVLETCPWNDLIQEKSVSDHSLQLLSPLHEHKTLS